MTLLEICVGSVADALSAETAGAMRIELCDGLEAGGRTPSFASIKFAAKKLKIPLHVMIRPREGNFVYTDLEFLIMQHDIAMVKNCGADGFVFGILNSDNTVDITRCTQLVELAHPFDVTFHRAFDLVSDFKKSLDDVIATGASALLTSGGKSNAFNGIEIIKQLHYFANNKIKIMAGGGITDMNIELIAKHSLADALHLSARKKINVLDPFQQLTNSIHQQYELDTDMITKCKQLFELK